MWTAADAPSHGHEACAGKSSHGATATPTSAAPTEMATVSSCLSLEVLRSAFHPACSTAAPRTANVTGTERSCTALENHLVDERPHALDGGAALRDRLGGAVEFHRAEIRQQRRDHHVRRIAGEAAARHLHLDDVERGGEHLENRRDLELVLHLLLRALEPRAAQAPDPAGDLHDGGALGSTILGAAVATSGAASFPVHAELAPAQVDRDHEIRAERAAHRHRHRVHQ